MTTNHVNKKSIGPLQEQGTRRIQHLVYQLVYIGDIWENPDFKNARQALDRAFALAVQSKKLNSVFRQYFDGDDVTVRTMGSIQRDAGNWTSSFSTTNAEQELMRLYAEEKHPVNSRKAPSRSAASLKEERATFFVLPPGTVLIGPDKENTLDDGLYAFHYHCTLPSSDATMYYTVATWGDGSFGIAKPNWHPWQNTCAMLYHEFSETITNPDVDTDKKAEMGWFNGLRRDEQEIADLAITYFGNDPLAAFKLAAVESGEKVPIQLLWSNADDAPWDPSLAPGLHPGPGKKRVTRRN